MADSVSDSHMEISTKSEQTEVPQVTKDTYAVQAVDNQAGIVVDGPMEDAEEQHDSTEGEPSVIICSFCNEGPSGCALCEPVGKAEVTENGAPTESEFVLEPEHVAEHENRSQEHAGCGGFNVLKAILKDDSDATVSVENIEDVSNDSTLAVTTNDVAPKIFTTPASIKEKSSGSSTGEALHVISTAFISGDESGAEGSNKISAAVDRLQHMRSKWPAQTPRPSGLHDSKARELPDICTSSSDLEQHSQFIPQGPRSYHSTHRINRPFQPYRPDDRQEVTRLNAKLMKLRNELDAEREKNLNMHKTISAEKQEDMEAALSSMTIELLRKQAVALSQQAKIESKERDLDYREKNIEQLEVYLTEGQKQLHHKYEEYEGGRTIADVDREFERRKGGLQVRKDMADLEAKVNNRAQDLQLREAAQQMREQQYKALMQASWEADMQQKGVSQDKFDEVADLEYNRGFGDGRTAGLKESEDETREKGFLEGYAACQRAHVVIGKLRQGLIAHDSPELEFLLNAAHPSNPFSIGSRIGAQESQSKAQVVVAMVEKKVQKVVQGGHKLPAESAETAAQVQKNVEVQVKKSPPARPTFASEFGKAQTLRDGHAVLANGAAHAATPTWAAEKVKGNKDIKGPNEQQDTKDGVDDGGPVQQAAVQEAQNLIDLH